MTAPRRAASPRRSRPAGPAPSTPARGRDRDGAAARKLEEAPLAAERAAEVGEREGTPFDGQYRIKLESFEGPLDLLLHLIQQHELDILDIPVSFITEKYLEYLQLMQVLSIEIASEYLVMAATLVHIKSKMLLPAPPPGQDDGMPQEEEEDPRAELVRRLLEYQKYKAAAAELAERGTLGRDIFPRGVEEEQAATAPAPFARVEVFGLLEAFERILKKSKVKIDHEVVFDRISITDRIVELTERLQGRRAVRFEWLFLGGREGPPTRFDLVITFLAMLEMCRMRLLRVHQTGPLAPIYMGLVEEGGDLSEEDRALADDESTAVLAPDPEPPAEEAMAESPPAEEAMAESPPAEEAMAESPPAEEAMAESPPAEEAMAESPAEEAIAESPPAEEAIAESPAEEAIAEPFAEEAMAVPPSEEATAAEGQGAPPEIEEGSAADMSIPEAAWDVSEASSAVEGAAPPDEVNDDG